MKWLIGGDAHANYGSCYISSILNNSDDDSFRYNIDTFNEERIFC